MKNAYIEAATLVNQLENKHETAEDFKRSVIQEISNLYEKLESAERVKQAFLEWESEHFNIEVSLYPTDQRLSEYLSQWVLDRERLKGCEKNCDRTCLERVTDGLKGLSGKMSLDPSNYGSLDHFLKKLLAVFSSHFEADKNAIRDERQQSLTRLQTIKFFLQSGILDREFGESKYRTTEGRIVDASAVIEKLKPLFADDEQLNLISKELYNLFPLYGNKQFTHHEKNTRLRGLLIYLEEEIDTLEHGDWRNPGLRTREDYDSF